MTQIERQQRRKRTPEHFIKSLPGVKSYEAMRTFIRYEQIYNKKNITYVDLMFYIGCNRKCAESIIRNLHRKKVIKKEKTKLTATAKWSLSPYGRKMYFMLEKLEQVFEYA